MVFARAVQLIRSYDSEHGSEKREVLLRVGVVLMIGLTYLGFMRVLTGFIPPQDKGYLIVNVQMLDGASLERTDAVIRRATEIIRETSGVVHAVGFAGFSAATFSNNSNVGAIFSTL